jgi:MFS family permease
MTDEVTGVASSAPLGALDILRVRPFAVLYLNSTAVILGVLAQTVARGWLAFQLTGSNAALGGVLLAFGVTALVATPWGGVVADRLPKRLVLQVSNGMLAVSGAWIGLAVAFGVVEYWMLLGAGVLQALAFALFGPVRMAFLAELLPGESLPNAVGLLLVNAEVTRVVGPAVAGVLIGSVSFGLEAVFLVGALLMALGMLLTGALPPGRRAGEASARSPLGELTDGIRYVAARPALSALLWCGVGVTMMGLPYLAFLPTVASDLFGLGSAGYGILSATSAAGAVVTGLLLGRRTHRGRQTRTLALAGAVMGLGLAGLAVAPSFWVAVVALLVVGGGNLTFQATNQSLLLSLADMAYHGRLQGLVMMSFGAFGIAALPLGVLADTIGLRWTFAAMGVGVVAVVGAFSFFTRGRVAREDRLHDLG